VNETDDSEFESNKEQSGAEAVKIRAGLQHPGLNFNCSSPRDGAILNEPDRN
jgi:hypothetical protein